MGRATTAGVVLSSFVPTYLTSQISYVYWTLHFGAVSGGSQPKAVVKVERSCGISSLTLPVSGRSD